MCYSLWYNAPTMLPAGSLEAEASRLPAGNIVFALYHKLNTQSSAPGDGQNNCPKHVELIGIINKTVIVASNWLSIIFISTMSFVKLKLALLFVVSYSVST